MRLEPMQPYLVSQVRPAILALMGAVMFLLLIACSNVANLFLVRASLRARDLAVRTAMGASWWRLARQMLAEALLVAAVGSVLGFGLAWVGIHDLLAIAPANLPRLDSIRIDPTVLAFTMVAGLAAAVLFGLAPALRAARPDVAQVLRASGRTAGLSGGSLLRNAVVVAEVALCFVLLVGSGLMFRSFLALQRIDPGFDSRGVLTFRTMGGKPGRTPEERAAIVRQDARRAGRHSGRESVTATSGLPLSGAFYPYRWGKADALTDFSKFQSADVQTVLPGYFETMHTPLLAGRTFDDSDNTASRGAWCGPGHGGQGISRRADAVGQRILMRFRIAEAEWFDLPAVVPVVVVLLFLVRGGATPQLESFRFVILGDRTGEARPGVYEQVWQEAAAEDPAFVVTVGDTIEGMNDATAQTEWQDLERILEPYGSYPLYFTPGNHDIWSAASEQEFRQYAGHRRTTASIGDRRTSPSSTTAGRTSFRLRN